jgi:hypothetical protein
LTECPTTKYDLYSYWNRYCLPNQEDIIERSEAILAKTKWNTYYADLGECFFILIVSALIVLILTAVFVLTMKSFPEQTIYGSFFLVTFILLGIGFIFYKRREDYEF